MLKRDHLPAWPACVAPHPAQPPHAPAAKTRAASRPAGVPAGRRLAVRVRAAKKLDDGRTTVKKGAAPAADDAGERRARRAAPRPPAGPQCGFSRRARAPQRQAGGPGRPGSLQQQASAAADAQGLPARRRSYLDPRCRPRS